LSLRTQIDCLKQIRIGRAGTPVSPSTARTVFRRWSDGRPSPSKRMLQFFALFSLLIIVIGAGDESARFNDLGHRMMCVCSCNQILLECNHVGCAYSTRMRNELAAALDRGDNDDLVLQSFVQKYGTVVIAAPTTKGFNRVAWIMPYLALVLGIGGVVLIVRTWRGRPLLLPAGSVKPVHGTELDHFREQARKETGDV
jgi:cytochrome c-type biogenesis protein CcmH